MSKFLQLHILTSYPPANLNRDDAGRPKTANMGGTERLRVSSQSLKRTWRTSDIFKQALVGKIGERTKLKGIEIYNELVAKGISEKNAKEWAGEIAAKFGKCKKKEKDKLTELEVEQLVHFSQSELDNIKTLTAVLAEENRKPEKPELELLRRDQQSADIALFGRMLTASPSHDIEAACQVAHAISIHPVAIEDDYFTAVDDLNHDDPGAAHIGESSFAAGVFYLYICINKSLLADTLEDEELANKSIEALIEAAVKTSPKGKQNTFGSRAYASYVLAEMGEQQPRSLSSAYLKAVNGRASEDFLADGIKKLEKQRDDLNQAYGECYDHCYAMNVPENEGSLKELIEFAVK